MKRIALDLDGFLIDFEKFVKKYGSIYYGDKYGLSIVNPNGEDVDQLFDLENYFKNIYPDYDETQIKKMVKDSKLDFWQKHMIQYCFKTPFRNGVKETINRLLSEGYQITVVTGRMFVENDNLFGKTMKKIVKKQFKTNGIDPKKLNFIWTSEKDNKRDIVYRNYFDIIGDDKPEILRANSDITNTITINTSYNIEENIGNAIRISSFENDEFYNGIKEIENKNNVLISNPKFTGQPSVDKKWEAQYNVGDKKWVNYNHSPYERLQMATMDYPDDIYIKYGLFKDLLPKVKVHKKITNKEFNKKVDECANALVSLGIKKGDLVPFQFANTPEAKIVIYALYKIKATVVPIFGLAEKDEIITKISSLPEKPKVYFITDIVYSKVQEAMEELDIDKVICLSPGTSLPTIEKIFYPVLAKVLRKKAATLPVPYREKQDKYIKFTEFIKKGKKGNYKFDTSFDNNYVAAHLFTGGTISFKGVELTEGNIDAGVHNFLNKHYDFRKGDTIGDFMPLDHTFGLLIANHIATSLGVTLDVILKLDPSKIDKIIERVNIFGGIPTLFNAIYSNPKVKKLELQKLRSVLSGGSQLKQQTRTNLNECLESLGSPAKVNDGYGLTETSGGVIYDGIPAINHDMKIVNPKTREELGYGDGIKNVGVLCVRGPLIMKGYSNNPKLTADVLEDGWFYTGDTGYIDIDGKFQYTNRLDDLIIVNGNNVYPNDIEKLLDTIDGIKNNSVIGKNDDQKGEVAVALIELEDGVEYTQKLEDEINEIYSQLPYFAKPVETVLVNKLADTRIFKPDKKAHRLVLNKIEETGL